MLSSKEIAEAIVLSGKKYKNELDKEELHYLMGSLINEMSVQEKWEYLEQTEFMHTFPEAIVNLLIDPNFLTKQRPIDLILKTLEETMEDKIEESLESAVEELVFCQLEMKRNHGNV